MKGTVVLVFMIFAVNIVISWRPPTTPSELSTEKLPTLIDCDIGGDDNNNDKAILLANPKDCSTYYICVGLNPILMKCPDGLEFSSVLKVCDWPQSAECTVESD
ncbi:peritrophin-1-like [Aphidius gifuensis]|uniref:peritrophin-1-like n=1 Tax=Aphidius gifuensis TaxID=684658 RepID=UPI001CDD43DB|nr:peritrophin-1-like [Aphidius gifuensis]